MPRDSVYQDLQNELEASASAEPLLLFLTVTHPTVAEVFRMVSNEYGDKIDDHIYGGETFYGIPFNFSRPTDDDRPARTRLGMLNINRRPGLFVLSLNSPCKIKVEMIAASDFTEHKDAVLDAHTEIGSASAIDSMDYLYLRNTTGDAMWFEGDLAPVDLTGEPFPALRSTPDVLPGLTY